MTINDTHDITYGMAINLLSEKGRLMAAANGEEIPDPEKQYNIKKANLPALEKLYAQGKVSEARFNAYVQSLREWESEE